MNEQLQEQLAEALSKAIEATETAGGFLAAELPEVIEQLLMWKLSEAGVLFSLCLVFAVGIAWGYRRIWVSTEGRHDAREDRLWGGCMALLIGSFPLAGMLINGNFALQILIAPKVYLLEYAARLAG